MTKLYRSSQRLQAVQDPVIPIIGKAIKDNPGTISLAQGVVHYAPPPSVFEAVEHAMHKRTSQLYGPAQGHPELIELIGNKLHIENQIDLTHGYEVMVTAGANMAFLNVILAICDPNDEVILLSPYYFNHEMAITMANCKAVAVATDAFYQPNIEALEQAITDNTKAIVTVSPNNPTGAVYEESHLKSINDLCKKHGIYHISDEAYEYFVYDDNHHFSPASMNTAYEHTISLYSLSKSYGLAGWRIGYVAYPVHLSNALKKVQDTNVICATQIAQSAAIAALNTGAGYCRQFFNTFVKNRQTCLSILKPLNTACELIIPAGAFYLFLKINTNISANALALSLIENYHVALLPGTTFGAHDGTYLRLSYGALSNSELINAMERLTAGLSHNIS